MKAGGAGWGILLASVLVLATLQLWLRPLMPVDETRYLSVAWEMWWRGDFLVPYLNGEPYSHKPPLLFWLMHGLWSLFGVSELAARLIPLLLSVLALWMSDESYALAIAEYERGRGSHWYFLGANVGVYVAWPTSGLLGGLLGASIPEPSQYGLDLVFPLGFLGLLTAFLKDRIGVAVALAAGGLALLGTFLLPGKWAILVAGILGSGLGLLLEEIGKRWRTS